MAALTKLKDCVEFGNNLAYIKVALEKWSCFCCAYCEGIMEFMAQMGKAMMIMMIARFFTTLGYLIIICGGMFSFYYLLVTLTVTPIMGYATSSIALPWVPIILSGGRSYFMAMLFMEVYELATLTFMFVRNKNEKFGEIYGPNKDKFNTDNIDNQEGVDELQDSILTPEQKEMLRAKLKSAVMSKISLNKVRQSENDEEEK